MTLHNYFKRIERPKTEPSAAAAGNAPTSAPATAATSDPVISTSKYFDANSSAAKQQQRSRTTTADAIDPNAFFTRKIHQSEKVVKKESQLDRDSKVNQKQKNAKSKSIAVPMDDDEFADFDIDLSQMDHSALKILDTKNSKVATPPKTASITKAPTPIKSRKATPIKRVFVESTNDDNDDDDDFVDPKSKSAQISMEPSQKKQAIVSSKKGPSPAKPNSLVPSTIVSSKKGPSPAKQNALAPFAAENDEKATPSVKDPGTAESSKKANYMKILAKKAAGSSGPANPGSKEIPVGQENCLTGLTFVFTGELSSISRDDAQDLVKRYGGRVTTGISGKTSYVIIGEEPGKSKLDKAATLKVKQMTEDEFFDLIRNSKGKAGGGSGGDGPGNGVKAVKTEAAVCKKVAGEVAVGGGKGTVRATAASLYGASQSLKEKEAVYSRDTESASCSAAPVRVHSSNDLWTTKYKPKTYDDIMGNKKNVDKLAIWLKSWNANTVTPKPSTAKDDPGKSRAVLISGPPGIGKTTAAHLVAKTEGFEIVEFNASDTRSKKTVGDVVKEMTGSHTLAEYFVKESDSRQKLVKKQVLIMDECDGMSAGDRGGIAELIKIIQKTKVPIICICNDRQSPKVKSLAGHCFDMRFQRPRTNELENKIKSIAAKEGLNIKFNAMETLVKSTQSDIRQILNMLSTYALQNNELSFDESRALSKSSEKNMSMSPWDVAAALLNRQPFRDSSFADKLELYFHDFSLIPLMIQENYIKMDPSLAHENGGPSKMGQDIEALNCLSQAADAIAYGDIISSVQMKTQNWGLLPFHGVMSTVRPAFFTHGQVVAANYFGGGFAFPGWLGKNSTQGKNMRLLKEIQLHMRLHVSADKNEVRQTYLPSLAPLLTVPLAQKENEGIEDVIQMMDEYYLTREDWDSILDLGLEECSGKVLTEKIPSTTKSAFTRIYNKGTHPKPFMTSSLLGKVSKSSSGGGAAPDLEDVFENDDEVVVTEEDGDEDEDSVGADRLIKQKVVKAGTGAKKATGTAKGGKRAGDTGKASSSKKQKF